MNLPVYYRPEITPDFGVHVFPAQKYQLIHDRLIKLPFHQRIEWHHPEKIGMDVLRKYHNHEYLRDVFACHSTHRTARSEIPLTPEVVDAILYGCGGTLQACQIATKRGRAVNLAGGFHHAFADHAEGFCVFNDVAIAASVMTESDPDRRILIVDLDVHQGNGTAKMLQYNDRCFTFSMHQENNYPQKEESDLDIGLADGVEDVEYLNILHRALKRIHHEFQANLLLYVAGVDVYKEDLLGGLWLTMEGVRRRDEIVIEFASHHQLPLAIVLAGGYARKTDDTVWMHVNTIESALF